MWWSTDTFTHIIHTYMHTSRYGGGIKEPRQSYDMRRSGDTYIDATCARPRCMPWIVGGESEGRARKAQSTTSFPRPFLQKIC